MLAVWLGHGVLLEHLSLDLRQDRLRQESVQLEKLLRQSYPDLTRAVENVEQLELIFQHAFSFRIGQQRFFSAGIERNRVAPLLSGNVSGTVYPEGSQRRLMGYRRVFQVNGKDAVLVVTEMEIANLAQWQRVHVSIAVLSILLLVILCGLTYVAVDFALSPIARVRKDLAELHSGRRSRLHDAVPLEFSGLVAEFNRLLEVLDDRLGRSRRATANLSHSIKTPLASVLAILENNASDISQDDCTYMAQQLKALHSTLDSQMRRRDVSGPQVNHNAQVAILASDLLDLVSRTFPDRHFRFSSALEPDFWWPVDDQDFSETVGNLLENAGKWSASAVHLELNESADGLMIDIHDDGEGIPLGDRERLLERWIRLDQQADGHGLGLSIVKEIVDSYDGRIQLLSSALGGLRVCVLFPR